MLLHMRAPVDDTLDRFMWRTQTKGEAVVPGSGLTSETLVHDRAILRTQFVDDLVDPVHAVYEQAELCGRDRLVLAEANLSEAAERAEVAWLSFKVASISAIPLFISVLQKYSVARLFQASAQSG